MHDILSDIPTKPSLVHHVDLLALLDSAFYYAGGVCQVLEEIFGQRVLVRKVRETYFFCARTMECVETCEGSHSPDYHILECRAEIVIGLLYHLGVHVLEDSERLRTLVVEVPQVGHIICGYYISNSLGHATITTTH